MTLIYHLVSRAAWEQRPAGPYRADSLAGEGFIHCSYQDQVGWVANSFYRDEADLLVLCIDTERLSSPVRDEDPGIGRKFPHVYGPIDPAAVVEARTLRRDAAGNWEFSG
jgi:uncharacterized protein (DUF952 family)